MGITSWRKQIRIKKKLEKFPLILSFCKTVKDLKAKSGLIHAKNWINIQEPLSFV